MSKLEQSMEELKRLAAIRPYNWTMGEQQIVNLSLPTLIARAEEVERLRAENQQLLHYEKDPDFFEDFRP